MTADANDPIPPVAPPPLPAPVIGYATPAMYSTAGAPGMFWRDGKTLIALKGAVLPQACVKCGGQASGKVLRKDFYWHAPWLYITILFPGLLIYAIIAIIIREKGTLSFSLCQKHRNRRMWGMLLAWTLIPGFIALLMVGLLQRSPWLYLVAALVALVGGIYGVVQAQLLRPSKIDKAYLWIRGASPIFLDGIPSV